MTEMGIKSNEGEDKSIILFDILIQILVAFSENNFEISYSVLTLAVTFYFTIIWQWQKQNQEIGTQKTKTESVVMNVFFVNLIPIFLATMEYQYDTIFTEAEKVYRILPIVAVPAICFIIWNFI